MKYLKVSAPVVAGEPDAQRDGTYAIVLGLLEVPPRGGFSVAEFYRRIEIMRVVKQAKQANVDILELDDDHAACLELCLADGRWGTFTHEVVEFDRAVKAMMSGETQSEDAPTGDPQR